MLFNYLLFRVARLDSRWRACLAISGFGLERKIRTNIKACHSEQSEESAGAQALRVLSFFLLIILFQNCSYQEVKNPSPSINTIKQGEKFMIVLPEDHSQNVIWKIDDKHNKKCIDYINSVFHGNENGVYYNFEALQKGQDTLNFALYKYNDVTKYASYIVKVE